MIRIAVLGDIGSGKSYVARQFGYPVFTADLEVAKLYKKNKGCYKKIKKILPKYKISFPIKKQELAKAIIGGQHNLKKIIKIVHPEVRFSMNNFIKKNKNKKFVEKKEINKRLKKRLNFNLKILKKFKRLQLPVEFKKRRSNFIIRNNFRNNSIRKSVKNILGKILLNARSNT